MLAQLLPLLVCHVREFVKLYRVICRDEDHPYMRRMMLIEKFFYDGIQNSTNGIVKVNAKELLHATK